MAAKNETPNETAEAAAEEGRERARETIDRLREEAPEQAEKLRERASEEMERASKRVREGLDAASERAERARELAGEGAHRAADRLRGFAGDHEGAVGRAASAAAHRLDQAGDYVEPDRSRASLNPLSMMKQYPIEAMVVVGAVAFVLIRALRR